MKKMFVILMICFSVFTAKSQGEFTLDIGYLHSVSNNPRTHKPDCITGNYGDRGKNTISLDLNLITKRGTIWKLDTQYGKTIIIGVGIGKLINKFFITSSIGAGISFSDPYMFDDPLYTYVPGYYNYYTYTPGYFTYSFGVSGIITELYLSVDAGYNISKLIRLSTTYSNLTGVGLKLGFRFK